MAGVNKAIILGHLGRDPELRHTQGGQPVCTLNIATSRRYTNKQNESVEETEWHRVSVWGKQAEHCNNFLAKGRQVYVEGRLHTSSYDKDGQKHYKTEIVADTVQFIGGHDEGGASQERNSSDAQRRNGGNAGPREAGGRNGGGAYGRNGGNAGAGAGSRPSAPEPNFDDFGGAPGDDDIPF